MEIAAALVKAATSPSPWDLGNEVLYSLCKTYPDHSSESAIIAKIWLIGRAYAAAIERRRNKTEENDDFYVKVVAPSLKQSDIDTWLNSLASLTAPTDDNFERLIQVHGKLTALFEKLTELEKRSLASKYLHFHLPHLFFIYDARAVNGLQRLQQVVGRASSPSISGGDNEYRKFFEKCLRLQKAVKEQHGATLSPRETDKLLLQLSAGVA